MDKDFILKKLSCTSFANLNKASKMVGKNQVEINSITHDCIDAIVFDRCSYKVKIHFSSKLDLFDPSCDCNDGNMCRHVSAVLLTVFNKSMGDLSVEKPMKEEKSALNPELLNYFNKLQSDIQEKPVLEQKIIKDVYAYAYCLEVSGYKKNHLGFYVMYSRIRKDLSYGSSSRIYIKDLLFSKTSAQKKMNMTELDWEIFFKALQNDNISYTSKYSLTEELLKKMIATKRCHFDSIFTPPLSFGDDITVEMNWEVDTSGNQELVFKYNGEPISVFNVGNSVLYIDRQNFTCHQVKSPLSAKAVESLLQMPKISANDATVVNEHIKNKLPGLNLPKLSEVKTDHLNNLKAEKAHILFSIYDVGYDFKKVYANVFVEYPLFKEQLPYMFVQGGQLCLICEKLSKKVKEKIYNFEHDVDFCRKVIKIMMQTNFKHEPLKGHKLGQFFIRGDYNPSSLKNICMDICVNLVPELKKEGWVVEFSKDFFFQDVMTPDEWYGDLEKKDDWFDLELGVLIDKKRINILPLLSEHLKKFDKEAFLSSLDNNVDIPLESEDKKIILVPSKKIKAILSNFIELLDEKGSKEKVTLSKWQLKQVSDFSSQMDVAWKTNVNLQEIKEKLLNLQNIKSVEAPKNFNFALRDYQKTGLSWLQFLKENEFGGILADDMGLGKTSQTLAHIMLEKENNRLSSPVLIVAPTTLMGNWANEINKFTPSLSFIISHGQNRFENFDKLKNVDIVLTTYPLLARDKDILLSHQFYMLILDEAQNVKNCKTQAHGVLTNIKAQYRICLTGTPMENHLGELWSLFHLIMPGFLGTNESFQKLFRKPIEKANNLERNKILSSRIKPFLLRRTKEEVLKELPPKIESISTIELTERQVELYESVRIAMHKKIKDAIQDKGLAKSQIIILDALLKLRQICCDPRLFKKEDSSLSEKDSAKLDYLLETLTQLIEENRKVLLFSQFTSMLDLIVQSLNRLKIPFSILTGETKDRRTPVEDFQSGKVPLMLISLKAGGVGLNLTAADTVIHYDPWWNPAVETQATDRAHRIGQEKQLFVYKLISQSTVEEKILKLQERKKNLISSVIKSNEKINFQLTEEELNSIFSPIS
ncbi:MAG: DEAD/DEAH box helicase [Chlamydiae bacterium]|nr:DEAD/DEAH box helicase [Chlamydiota bacterium]